VVQKKAGDPERVVAWKKARRLLRALLYAIKYLVPQWE
jgi:hypothetical protein